MAPIIPIALGAGALLAYKKAKKKKGMTPERKKIFEEAIKHLDDPAKLRKLAASFDKEGLKEAGNELRKRAQLREMPEPVKQARREAYKKGMSSTEPAKILKLANAFHKEGAYGAAQNLRDYAKGISSKVTAMFHHPPGAGKPITPQAAAAAASVAAHGDDEAGE